MSAAFKLLISQMNYYNIVDGSNQQLFQAKLENEVKVAWKLISTTSNI